MKHCNGTLSAELVALFWHISAVGLMRCTGRETYTVAGQVVDSGMARSLIVFKLLTLTDKGYVIDRDRAAKFPQLVRE